jgi:hypothetical protein
MAPFFGAALQRPPRVPCAHDGEVFGCPLNGGSHPLAAQPMIGATCGLGARDACASGCESTCVGCLAVVTLYSPSPHQRGDHRGEVQDKGAVHHRSRFRQSDLASNRGRHATAPMRTATSRMHAREVGYSGHPRARRSDTDRRALPSARWRRCRTALWALRARFGALGRNLLSNMAPDVLVPPAPPSALNPACNMW